MIPVRYSRNLFLRGICIIYLFAFLGTYIQIPGLFGENGLTPAQAQINVTDRKPLLTKLIQKPTLLWFAPYLGLTVDYMLDVVALCGAAISFYGFISQRFCISSVFAILWGLYYSIFQVGQVFLRSKCDLLLLEIGFLCIIIAPLWYSKKQGKVSTPSDLVTFWTVRFVLCRFLFSTGMIKFIVENSVWWTLKGLTYHFQSMALPSPFAWYCHYLPTWFLKLTMVYSHATELLVPLLFFFPNRNVKIIAFYIQLFLQLNIIATGNFHYLNYLIICICISLLDDQFFYRKKSKQGTSNIVNYVSTAVAVVIYIILLVLTIRLFNVRITDSWTIESSIAITKEQFNQHFSQVMQIYIYGSMISLIYTIAKAVADSAISNKDINKNLITTLITFIYSVIVVVIYALSIVPFSTLHPKHSITVPAELKQVYNKIQHLHIVNPYGQFTEIILSPNVVEGRSEIIIEGQTESGAWKEYEFLYKPGNVSKSLPFCAPYQPRLDWQMWSAALEPTQRNPWMLHLLYQLSRNQPEVLALMDNAKNPFKNQPPKVLRATFYQYRLSNWTDVNWWSRKFVKEYFTANELAKFKAEYLPKLKGAQRSAPKVTNVYLKMILDTLRSIFSNFEGSLLLWSILTAGCAIIMTNSNSNPKKKSAESGKNYESTGKSKQSSTSGKSSR